MSEPKMDIFERHPQPLDTLTTDSAATDAEHTQAKEDLGPSPGIVLQDHNPSAAFEKFAGRVYETASIDYSGTANPISASRLRERLASAQAVASSRRGGPPEPPVTRFARLKSELADLRGELELMAEKEKLSAQSVGAQQGAGGNSVAAIAEALTGELDSMSSELEGVASQSEFAPFVLRASGASDGAKRRQIAEAVKSAFSAAQTPASAASAAAAEPAAAGAGGASAAVRAAASLMRVDSVHTADLERRVAQLETVLGSTSLSPYPDVHTALAHLEDRLDLLSPAALEQIRARVDNVNQELDKLAKKSDSALGKQADRIDKVSKLYDTMQRWDATAHQLPIVIARLQSQRELNQANAGAAVRLKRLEDANHSVAETLKKDRELLVQMQANLQQAAEQMKANVKEMDSRVKRIEKKAKKLGI